MKQAPKFGAGSDEVAGVEGWQPRPATTFARGIVRTSPFSPRHCNVYPRSLVSSPAAPGRSSFEQTLQGGEISICLRGGGASKAEAPHGGRPLPADLQRETVRFAVGADCCGCLGCRETENLLEVTTKRGTRVLCPEHVEGWVNRG